MKRTVSDEEQLDMIITRKALPRRTFLKGMHASLALPLLDAMIPAATAGVAVTSAFAPESMIRWMNRVPRET